MGSDHSWNENFSCSNIETQNDPNEEDDDNDTVQAAQMKIDSIPHESFSQAGVFRMQQKASEKSLRNDLDKTPR
jgi:hypothetical protein